MPTRTRAAGTHWLERNAGSFMEHAMHPIASSRVRSRVERVSLLACIVSFSVFFLNILYGRFAPAFDWNRDHHLDGVPEFLLLFLSAIFFTVATLAAERQGNDPPD
ncbi:MAG TPA: hypothetical protein PK725_12335 [Rhodocyclaceae bacterium]|jgi:hypothetical protein|nr:hypothetical protein [Rhodocyclaceae bacterium]HRQ47733.1 hypothetical protein [Rhodocyclaceae bacterium]